MNEWPPEFMRRVVDNAPEGIVICEARGPEQPVVYANRCFQELTGYQLDELVGGDLRRLQGRDREQSGRSLLRMALNEGKSARALLRNYRKDGGQFWNEVLIEPMRDADQRITHFVGFHRDVGKGHRAVIAASAPSPPALVALTDSELPAVASGVPRYQREDRASGLHSRAYFEELLQLHWELALCERRAVTLLMFDINSLGLYNETFGRTGGDACIRRVARVLAASFRRGEDVLARWDGGTFCVLSQGNDLAATTSYAETVAQRVLELQIHHPHSRRQRYVSLNTGAAHLVPAPGTHSRVIIAAVTHALLVSRSEHAGRVIVADANDSAAVTTRNAALE
jgi:diguanylate cyclase (GGDEF)-like protein/PAS domain S-box-containing protein